MTSDGQVSGAFWYWQNKFKGGGGRVCAGHHNWVEKKVTKITPVNSH